MAAELELAFGEASSRGVRGYVGAFGSIGLTGSGKSTIFTATPNISFGDGSLTFKDQRLTIDPCKSSMGQWQWESVGVRTGRVPTPLRRLLMRVLVGAEWVPDTKDPVSLGAEYDRLQEFIDSLQSCPMEV